MSKHEDLGRLRNESPVSFWELPQGPAETEENELQELAPLITIQVAVTDAMRESPKSTRGCRYSRQARNTLVKGGGKVAGEKLNESIHEVLDYSQQKKVENLCWWAAHTRTRIGKGKQRIKLGQQHACVHT